MLPALDPALFPPALRTAHELVVAGIAIRRLRDERGACCARSGRSAPRATHVFLR